MVPPRFDPAKQLRPFYRGRGSGGDYAEEKLSGRAHSILCKMSLFISTIVHVVSPMFFVVYHEHERP